MQTQLAPEQQRKTILKVSWRLLPLIVVCYLVNYIDRTNVSFAALTMNKDLGLSAYLYGLGAGIFFFGYALFEVPSNIVLQRDRRAPVDRPHHDHLGHHLRSDGDGHGADQLSRAALSAGRGRSRLLPRHDLLSYQWFPVRGPRPRHIDLVHRCARLERGGFGDLGCHSGDDGRHARPQRLAVGLHHRGDPGGAARLRRLVADDGAARRSQNGSSPRSASGSKANWRRSAAESRAPATSAMLQALIDPRVLVLSAIYFTGVTASYGIVFFMPQIIKGLGLSNYDDRPRDRDPVHHRYHRPHCCGATPRTGTRSAAGISSSRPGSLPSATFCAALVQPLLLGGRRHAGRRGRHLWIAALVLADALAVPHRRGSRSGHGADQFDRQPRRLRRTA